MNVRATLSLANACATSRAGACSCGNGANPDQQFGSNCVVMYPHREVIVELHENNASSLNDCKNMLKTKGKGLQHEILPSRFQSAALTGHSHAREPAENLTQEYRRDCEPQHNEHPPCH